MDTEYEQSRVERMKRGLYSPGEKNDNSRPPELTKQDFGTKDEWESEDLEKQLEENDALHERELRARPKSVAIIKAMIVCAVFAVVGSVGYLTYTLIDPLAKPSDKNIDLLLEVPVAISSGSVTLVALDVVNRNKVPLEYAVVTAIYPSGTRSGTDTEKTLKEEKKILGNIETGGKRTYSAQVIFLGEENTDQIVRFQLEYRFAGISSSFVKEIERPIRLSSSPVNVVVKTLEEVNSGQTIDFEIVASSNTVVPLDDVVLKIEYPQGFEFIDATPAPTFANSGWAVGTLKPGDKYTLRMRGVLSGENGQKRSFKTTIGMGDAKLSGSMTETYSEVLSTLSLRESFIGVELFFDNKPVGESIGNFGKRISGKVLWKNNLRAKILDAQIEVKIKGTALDRKSIVAEDGGFYRSLDDTIFWDQRNTESLGVVDIDEQGTVGFSFLPLPPITNGQVLRNPTVTAEISIRGKRISETGVPEEVKTLSIRTVRVTSQVQFASRAVHFVGPITNRGPIPPRVDQETTYTIVWSIVNSSNDITAASVRAVLPPYARFTGTVSPLSEPLVYNENTKQVIWTPGNISAGIGVTSAPREVYFQIAVRPSLSQVNTPPEIVYAQDFSARDAFTGEEFLQKRPALSTLLSTDPSAKEGDALVVE